MKKIFYHHMNGKRPIEVNVGPSRISFHFKKEGNREFYAIPTDEWVSDRTTTRQGRDDNWHFHMMEKIWFNQDMKTFIDDNTKEKIR